METVKDKLKTDQKVTDFAEIFTIHVEGQSTPLRSDLEIRINHEIFKVHKIILTNKNEVFRVMLESPMIESTENRMEITDCDSSAFKTFLVYLYTNEVSSENIDFDLLMIAEKYLDIPLKKLCFEKLGSEISSENVVEIARLATQFNFEELIIHCQKFFTKNYKKMTGTPQLKAILKNKPLTTGIVKEYQDQRDAASKAYDELLMRTKTHKFILDGLNILFDEYTCEDCGQTEAFCYCSWYRNRYRGGFKPIAHSLRFFADDVEWSMKVSYDQDEDRTVGIDLIAEDKHVRADVRLTVLSNDSNSPDITFIENDRHYGRQFFGVRPRAELEFGSNYVSDRSYFTLELYINVLSG